MKKMFILSMAFLLTLSVNLFSVNNSFAEIYSTSTICGIPISPKIAKIILKIPLSTSVVAGLPAILPGVSATVSTWYTYLRADGYDHEGALEEIERKCDEWKSK